MGFTFRAFFSGVCHFVENNGRAQPKCRMCVVMPDATDHKGIIKKRHGLILDSSGREIQEIVLNGHRVVFRLSEERRPQPIGSGLGGVIVFRDIAGGFVDDNPDIVKEKPSASRVRAHVLLDRGEFKASTFHKWKLPGRLTGADKQVDVAKSLYLEIKDLRGIDIIVMRFNQDLASGAIYSMQPEGGSAAILVANDCQKLILEDSPRSGLPDTDFDWHYRMLRDDKLEALREELKGEPRPVPISLESPQLNPAAISSNRDLAELFSSQEVDKMDLSEELYKTAVTYTGCNCLGCYGEQRELLLDSYIPNP